MVQLAACSGRTCGVPIAYFVTQPCVVRTYMYYGYAT